MNVLTAQGSNGLYVGANADGGVLVVSIRKWIRQYYRGSYIFNNTY